MLRRQRERRERERERTSGLSQSVRFFSPLILFHVMGLVLRRRNGTEKNTLLSLSSLAAWRCHDLPGLNEFSGAVLSRFILSRQINSTKVLLS